jgi:lysophospholipase L1-like esterase
MSLLAEFPIVFYDFGRSGATSNTLVNVAVSPSKMRVRAVVIECGMNDANLSVPLATFENNIKAMVDGFRASDSSTEILLMTMNPAISPASNALISALPAYYQTMRDLSSSLGIGIIDNTPSWGSPTTVQIPDGVHPTPESAQEVIIPNLLSVLGPMIT